MALDAGDDADVQAWADGLTYREIHAFTYGFTLAAAAVVMYTVRTSFAVGIATVSVAILVYAVSGKSLPVPVVERVAKRLPGGVRKQVGKEPHYYGGGLVVGAVAAGLAVWVGLPA